MPRELSAARARGKIVRTQQSRPDADRMQSTVSICGFLAGLRCVAQISYIVAGMKCRNQKLFDCVQHPRPAGRFGRRARNRLLTAIHNSRVASPRPHGGGADLPVRRGAWNDALKVRVLGAGRRSAEHPFGSTLGRKHLKKNSQLVINCEMISQSTCRTFSGLMR